MWKQRDKVIIFTQEEEEKNKIIWEENLKIFWNIFPLLENERQVSQSRPFTNNSNNIIKNNASIYKNVFFSLLVFNLGCFF